IVWCNSVSILQNNQDCPGTDLARKLCLSRQLKNPHRTAAIGRILYLGHKPRPRCRMCAAITDVHRDVLFTTHCERHRSRSGNIVEADAPQFLASLIVVRAEPTVNRSAEDQPSRRGENPRGLRRTLTPDKDRLACLDIRCLN